MNNGSYMDGLLRAMRLAAHMMDCKEAITRDTELNDHPIYRVGFIDGCMAVFEAITAEMEKQTGTMSHEQRNPESAI